MYVVKLRRKLLSCGAKIGAARDDSTIDVVKSLFACIFDAVELDYSRTSCFPSAVMVSNSSSSS